MKLISAVTEVSALRACCATNKLVASTVLSRVDEDWFGLNSSKEFFKAIKEYINDTGNFPSWTMLMESPSITKSAKRSVRTVGPKSKIPKSKEHAQALVDNLNKYRKLRKAADIYELIGDSLESEKADLDGLLDQVGNMLTDARTSASYNKDQFMSIGRGDNSLSVIKDVLSGMKGKVTPSGFEAFDKVNGGFLDGSLVIMGANTGGGKTAAAISMLEKLSYEYAIDTALVSLEMSKQQCMSRIMAIRSGVPTHKISSGKLTKAEKQKVKEAYTDYRKKLASTNTQFTIWEPDTDISIEDALLTLQPMGHKVIVVDYISLLKGTDGDDQWKALNRVARYAKVHARNTGTIVVLLVQVNDDGKIKFARSIADHANNAWLWTAPKESEEVSIYDINQLKARNQQRFKMRFESHNPTGRIRSLNADEMGGGYDEDDGYDKEPLKDINDVDDED